MDDADPLNSPVTSLPGVTRARQEQLKRLGVETVGQLLFHFPRTYEDLSDVRSISQLSAGAFQTVRGEVVEITGDELANGMTVVRIVISDDGKTCLEGTWFNQPWTSRHFRFGQQVVFSGKPKWYRGHWQMSNPRWQALESAERGGIDPKLGIIPIYPLTEDLRLEDLRPLVRLALDRHATQVVEVLPEELRDHRQFPGVHEALYEIHFPKALSSARQARRRFVYEEFLVLQLALALRRRDTRERHQAPRLPVNEAIDRHIRRLFPFELTPAQNAAVREISADLAGEKPMQRLLQADVGAGKTAVAVYALLTTVANKHQAALMAPTEILARQHYQTLERYLIHSRVRRLLLTGGMAAAERKAAHQAIQIGEVDLVVGTQALIQEAVQFHRLGLVVIDEQHRFGVEQRARFRRQGDEPHYLVMTATPIPRTLALTVFGDLDISTLQEMPPGRQAPITRLVAEKERDALYAKFREELNAGRQGYVICPFVEERENIDVKSAIQTHAELQAGPFKDYRLGLVHGRMTEEEKATVMADLRSGAIQLLVSTSIVEVGVDVPQATLMIIEHAERFGLSQLHQLRGRISRGSVAGRCYLFAEAATDESQERLRIFVATRDGFALAEADAELRGGGELFGTRQHGLGELRLGDLQRDQDLLGQARRDAFAIVKDDGLLSRPEHQLLKARVMDKYGKTLELPEIG